MDGKAWRSFEVSKYGVSSYRNASNLNVIVISLKILLDSRSKSNSSVLSASDVLDRIKKRNGMAEVSNSETQILTDLRNFISSEGGTASTDRLVETFEKQLPASATPLFKSLLNKICTFYRGPDKKGYWNLKPEFLR